MTKWKEQSKENTKKRNKLNRKRTEWKETMKGNCSVSKSWIPPSLVRTVSLLTISVATVFFDRQSLGVHTALAQLGTDRFSCTCYTSNLNLTKTTLHTFANNVRFLMAGFLHCLIVRIHCNWFSESYTPCWCVEGFFDDPLMDKASGWKFSLLVQLWITIENSWLYFFYNIGSITILSLSKDSSKCIPTTDSVSRSVAWQTPFSLRLSCTILTSLRSDPLRFLKGTFAVFSKIPLRYPSRSS